MRRRTWAWEGKWEKVVKRDALFLNSKRFDDWMIVMAVMA